MSRSPLRRHVVALACALAVAGPLLVAGTTGSGAPAASAGQTPGQRAASLKKELHALDRASDDLRRRAAAARSALVVGTARWQASKKRLVAARKDAKTKAADLAEARRHLESERRSVVSYAVDAYQNPVGTGSALADGLASDDPIGQARTAADLDQVNGQETAGLSHYAAAKIAAQVFADRARQAAAAATRLEASLHRQTLTLRSRAKKSTAALTRAVAKVNAVQARVDKLQEAEQARLARLARRRAAAGGGGSSGGAVGSPACHKGSGLNYPNGLVPQSALCPLPQAGWYLRADAARAFYRLNAAYAARFGGGMCVNSAYRPLQRQYELFRSSRPGYAAVPGTSNHGEGIAVDLGCGVNVSGSTQFTWLKANAGRYGWMHPYWAEHNPFEPWHWEYHG